LQEKLGEGSFGVAVKAIHRETNEIRAIKTMAKRKVSRAQKKIAKFNSEIEILQTLEHPGILRLYEAYEDANNYYLVTEYCSGGELFDYVVAQNYLSEQIAGDVMV
jgi:calcium-dependent protein kinase